MEEKQKEKQPVVKAKVVKEKKNKGQVGLYILIFLLGALAMYAVLHYSPVAVNENITKVLKDVTVTDTGIADGVEKIYDAVVVVSTYKNDDFIASGTGFVYKKEKNKYFILTNNHVIEGGNKIIVTFTDSKTKEVKVLGTDEFEDIAVLQLESKEELKVAQIGDNSKTRVGDTTFAVGAPLDSAYSWTVTRGILSGKDRLVEVSLNNKNVSDYVMKVIQTDTAINAGNSGGPLCNANGEVIGINSLKLVSSGVEAMGFAIPIEGAIKKAEDIIEGKVVIQPYLGIGMTDLMPRFYYLALKYEVNQGVVILSVDKNSSAEKGGIKEGDIVTKLDDHEIKNTAYFRYYLYQHEIGDKVKITVNREGKTKNLELTLKAKMTS